jgi:predicted HTH transcriptional regulator
LNQFQFKIEVQRERTKSVTLVTRADIARGEGPGLEFKESLILDVKKHVIGGQPIEKCFSDEVLHSTLKTIAAYVNSGGGTLLVGVADDAGLSD